MSLLSPTSWSRVFAVTIAGTLLCIAVALYVDSYNFASLSAEARHRAILTNIFLPLGLAGPLLFLFMWKMRQLAFAHQELQALASTDSLTAVLNRGAFTMMVEAYLERADKEVRLRSGAFLVIDADRFKAINDDFGHDTGDRALRMIAQAIRGALRGGDLVGRLGGEEFGVFLPGTGLAQSKGIAERIREAVAAVAVDTQEGKMARVSVSIGGVSFSSRADFDGLYIAADKNLYAAKTAGRNRVCLLDFLASVLPTPPPVNGSARPA